ncbi:MAG: Multidrug resistance efflux pump [Chthonomonadaceae bacterium]|nr:Multidrug resistance efflux pump [Chthonomonadaceae bacterium]
MTRVKALILGGAATLAVIGVAAWILRPHEASPIPLTGAGAPPTPPAKVAPPPDAEIQPAAPTSLSLLGSVQSEAQSTLSVRMPGRIVAVATQEGAAVHAGQILISLDDTDVRGQIRQAEAGALAARTQVNHAEQGRAAQQVKADGEVQTARDALERAQRLEKQAAAGVEAARSQQQTDVKLAREGVKTAEQGVAQAKQTLASLEELNKIGGVARNDLDGARRQVTIADSNLASAIAQLQHATATDATTGEPMRVAAAQRDLLDAQQGVQAAEKGLALAVQGRKQAMAVAASDVDAARAALVQAQAGVASAQNGMAQTRLASPIEGVVSAVSAHVGETAQPGMPLLTVVSLSGLRADALVPARQLSRIHLGQEAHVAVDTDPNRSYPAVVSDIARVAEPDGRTFHVRFHLTTKSSLRPGQTARITVPLHP